MNLLIVENLSKSFRGLKAVSNASFEVPEGSINALIGPNGAGKTTIFNMIAGVFPPDSGSILFQGKPIHGLRPDQVCAAGIGRTFQIVKPFAGLSVLENVMIGAFLRETSATGARRAATEILERLQLGAKRDLPASSLTLPDRKRLEVARALATRPKLLLLDEPMAGMAQEDVARISALIRKISANRTILMVEHNLSVVADLSDRITVLARGQVLAEGPYETVAKDPRVIEAYIGAGHE
jgi:branched-chain amino acid transport system ATP-binding protein